MAIVKYKPTSAGRRNMSTLSNDRITKSTPEKSLLAPLNKKGGRNNTGRITTRHQGGGVKQKYRIIDFRRNKDNANIALLHYLDGEKRYIICPADLHVGDTVISGEAVDIKIGNAMELKNIPDGTVVHNIELTAGKGGQMARAAGCSAQILGSEGNFVTLRLSSGEVRRVHSNCRATVGSVGNGDYNLINLGKATVRGSAMNPVDHPHGGGEGRAPVGRKSPMTPWGKKAMGVKTRKPKNKSNQYIVRRRNGK